MTSSLILVWAFVFIALSVYSEFTRPTSDSLRNWRILRDMILSKDFLWSAAFCISLGWILVACGNDRREYFYQTLADADKAGEITRGWIPHDLIPNSSRAIHLVEELSPSKEWCAFEFPLADAEILRKNLKSIDTLPPSVRRVQTPGVSWWPEVLKGKLNVEKIRKAGFEPYVVERPANSVTMGIYLFALDWSKGRGFFYWTVVPPL